LAVTNKRLSKPPTCQSPRNETEPPGGILFASNCMQYLYDTSYRRQSYRTRNSPSVLFYLNKCSTRQASLRVPDSLLCISGEAEIGSRNLLIIGALVAIATLVLAFAMAPSAISSSSVQPRPTQSPDLTRIVYPMDLVIKTIATGSSSNMVVTIFAYNNLYVEPNYSNATVHLTSLNLTISYSFDDSGGQAHVINVTLNPNVAESLNVVNNQTTFSVDGGSIPQGLGGEVAVQITGGYTWVLQSSQSTADGTLNRTVNGQGLFPEFSSKLVVSG
jgi:hypothetical protein